MRLPIAAAGVATILLAASPALAQLSARPVFRAFGAAAGDQFGASVARAGDLNGDGFPDLLIGAPRADTQYGDAGRAYVLLGGTRLDSIPDASAAGRTPVGLAGTTLAGVGDVNGDGYDDWLVGSPNYDTGVPPRFQGKAWLYFGGASLDATSDRTLNMPGGQPNSALFGLSIAALGDVNGDGAPDFLVSAFVAPGDSTSAFVYFGGPNFDQYPDVTLHTGPGYTVRASAAGDVNGDGWNDIVVGESAPVSTLPGRVQVFYGGPSLDATADVTIVSSDTADHFGYAVSSGGDLNGDGDDDIVVGASTRLADGLSFAGQALVYFGGPGLGNVPGLTISGGAGSDNLGTSVALDGDLDGDGYADLLVGVPGADAAGADAGRVLVFYGSPDMDAVPDLVVDGDAPGEFFGAAVSFAGDPDLGGSDAFLVGAPSSDVVATNAGRAVLERAARFAITRPTAGERWRTSGSGTVAWTGADPATVELSLDGGASWQAQAETPGGAGPHQVEIPVPAAPTGRARVRLTRTGHAPGAGESSRSPGEFHITGDAPGTPAVFGDERTMTGGSPGRLGTTVGLGVDALADGLPDLIAGAPYSEAGAVEIQSEPGQAGFAASTRAGLTAFEQYGASLADAGDLDGDGWDDLVVGAPSCGEAGVDAGRVYVYFGGPTASPMPGRVIDGQHAGELFGASVAAGGDLDGDGHPDLVVGAPGVRGDGRVYVFSGGPGFDDMPDHVLTAGVPGPFGLALSAAGDVNGDGVGDLLVAGPPMPGGTGSSSVHVFFGRPGAAPWKRVVLDGVAPGDGFGEALAALGDVDGDGFDDFAVGLPFADVATGVDAGAVQVYLGGVSFVPRAAVTLTGERAGEHFGSAIAGGADLDGDGRPDFAVGAPGADDGGLDAGRVACFSGGVDFPARQVFLGTPRSRLGSALAMRPLEGDERFGVLAMGAPFAEAPDPGVRALVSSRWRWSEPRGGQRWLAGTPHAVRWLGDVPAEVWFVGADGGETRLAGAAGAPDPALEIALPAALPDSGRLELRAADPAIRGRVASDPIRLVRTVTIHRFVWEPRGDGIALSWGTDPPLGSGGVAGYRLWRHRGGGAREAVGAVIADTSAFDPDGRAGDAYELAAVNAAGDTFAAGTLPAGNLFAGIRAWPQPAGESGEITLSFAAPRANGGIATDLEVRVFDVRGRSIRTLARGRPATDAGVVSLRWDGRTDRGIAAGPGLYFVRVRSASAGYEASRRLVMLDAAR